jgi:hypothetical protein
MRIKMAACISSYELTGNYIILSALMVSSIAELNCVIRTKGGRGERFGMVALPKCGLRGND